MFKIKRFESFLDKQFFVSFFWIQEPMKPGIVESVLNLHKYKPGNSIKTISRRKKREESWNEMK